MGTKNNPGKFDCYEKAEPDEPMFVLLARDPLAPALVEAWASEHLRRQPAASGFSKYQEVMQCAADMRAWQNSKEKKEQ
jgi:hypothetical protein